MTNKSEIQEGNQNVVIQGVKFSNIKVEINSLDIEELKALLNKKQTFTIFIVTTIWEKLKNDFSKENNKFEIEYHTDYKDWKPFSNEKTLLGLLEEYQMKYDIKFDIFILDCIDDHPSRKLTNYLDTHRQSIIWIIDVFALLGKGNRIVSKQILDAYEVGACLIPFNDSLKENATYNTLHKSNTMNNFPKLTDYTVEYFDYYSATPDDKGLIHIDLEIKTKHTLFRRLTAICSYRWTQIPKEFFASRGVIETEKIRHRSN